MVIDVKSQLHPDAGKDWRQEEKGMTEDKVVEWHHQLNGHEFEQALGDGEGYGSLAYCSPWGCKDLDTTERLNNNKENKKENLDSNKWNVLLNLYLKFFTILQLIGIRQ